MRTSRRQPPTPPAGTDPVLDYALRQLDWYARVRDRARRWHWSTETMALACGAGTVAAAGLQAPAAVTATLAGAMVFTGGFRQVFNHMERYIIAAEAWYQLHLAVERYQLLPEVERDAGARARLLERTEEATSLEFRNWATLRRAALPAPAAGGQPPAAPPGA